MDMNFTIPVNEAFEASAADPGCGCPLCALARKLEADELDLILGASMMEPDVRIVVWLWQTDEDFPKKLRAQPLFCLPHYRLLLAVGQKRLGKKKMPEFAAACGEVVGSYMAELQKDISWFCKKFDYRFQDEPWGNSKDAVERAIRFLRSDIHNK